MTGDHLRQLAHRIRRLGVAGRVTPETVLVEKDDIAAELARLARAAPRPATAVPPPPAPVRPTAATLAAERARRTEALARSQAVELERLRGMLAAAVRRPARRRRGGDGQLELPLT